MHDWYSHDMRVKQIMWKNIVMVEHAMHQQHYLQPNVNIRYN